MVKFAIYSYYHIYTQFIKLSDNCHTSAQIKSVCVRVCGRDVAVRGGTERMRFDNVCAHIHNKIWKSIIFVKVFSYRRSIYMYGTLAR